MPYFVAAINDILSIKKGGYVRATAAELFGLLDGALVSGPAHVLPSSELKRLHDERSSHGLPAPTAEEELALQTARRLSAWQANTNKIYFRLFKEASIARIVGSETVRGCAMRVF